MDAHLKHFLLDNRHKLASDKIMYDRYGEEYTIIARREKRNEHGYRVRQGGFLISGCYGFYRVLEVSQSEVLWKLWGDICDRIQTENLLRGPKVDGYYSGD